MFQKLIKRVFWNADIMAARQAVICTWIEVDKAIAMTGGRELIALVELVTLFLFYNMQITVLLTKLFLITALNSRTVIINNCVVIRRLVV